MPSPTRSRVRVFVDLWVEMFAKHNLLTYASAIAFQTLVALVPLVLLGLALLDGLGKQSVWTNGLRPGIEERLTPATFGAVADTVERIFETSSAVLIALAALAVVWEISGAVRAVMGALNQVYDANETRGWRRRFPVSFGIALAISVALVGAGLALGALPELAGAGAWHTLLLVARWPIAIVLLAAATGILFGFAPAERRAWRWISAGSAVVVFGWLVASILFKLYVTSVASFTSPIGNLTVILVLTAYLYTSAIILLVGAELDELLRKDATMEQLGIIGRLRRA